MQAQQKGPEKNGRQNVEQIKRKRINKQMKTAVDNHTLLHTEEVK
jgi:hypothetical protein